MADMKLNAEVFLRIEGHEEIYNIGTIDVPINVTFGGKPTLGNKRGATVEIDEVSLSNAVTDVAKRLRR